MFGEIEDSKALVFSRQRLEVGFVSGPKWTQMPLMRELLQSLLDKMPLTDAATAQLPLVLKRFRRFH